MITYNHETQEYETITADLAMVMASHGIDTADPQTLVDTYGVIYACLECGSIGSIGTHTLPVGKIGGRSSFLMTVREAVQSTYERIRLQCENSEECLNGLTVFPIVLVA